jgi:tetratricopeptide (TPR) repeat protein
MQNASAKVHESLQRALYALQSNRPGDAERIAAEILKSDPKHSRALHILGCAMLMQDRAEDALAPLEAAARERRDPEVDTQLAMALRQVGRNEDALSRLKRAAKRQPPYAPAFRELGAVLFAMARYDEAIEALNRGLQIAPMMPDLSIQLGYVLLEIKNLAGAQAAFGRALAISPGSPDALFGLAKAHRDADEHGPAAEYFRRYLMVAPDDQSAWLHLGHCLLELRQDAPAHDCFRTAARGDARHYGTAFASLVAAKRGRFWIRRSAAAGFLTDSTRQRQ